VDLRSALHVVRTMKHTVVIKMLDGKMGRTEIDLPEGEDLPVELTAADGSSTAEFTGDWVGRFDGPSWPVYQEVKS
jgi:hypothetical protein